ncbi:MAG TPA: hypothetical protein VGJ95_16455 [Pseudonocardiaceae bacterium]
MSTHDYGHLTVEDGAGGEEAEASPADTTRSAREVGPSGPSAALSTHDYGHLTVEDESG